MDELKHRYLRIGACLRALGIVLVSLSVIFGGLELFAPRSQARPLRINCLNNLKQIVLAFKTWAIDHDDRFPFNVRTNQDGSMEFCSNAPDGFDPNAYRHLLLMSNELSTPRILVCPQDRKTKAATNFFHLRPENISYKLRSGTNVTDANGQAVLMACPIDGNILHCDGSVTAGPNQPPIPLTDRLNHFEENLPRTVVLLLTIGFLLLGFALFHLGTALKLGRKPGIWLTVLFGLSIVLILLAIPLTLSNEPGYPLERMHVDTDPSTIPGYTNIFTVMSNEAPIHLPQNSN